jgi:hypothetical protein
MLMASRTNLLHTLALLIVLGLAAAGCTNDPIYDTRSVQVSASNIPQLDGDAYYELWFSYPADAASIKGPRPDHSDDAYFSVGRFKVDGTDLVGVNGGSPIFTIPPGHNPNLLIDAILTVQSGSAVDTTPGPRMLAGIFAGSASQGRDTLVANGDEALGSKILASDSGRMVLDAPTGAATDGAHGIWFVELGFDSGGVATPIPGLTLSPMPLVDDNADWRYQAWLVHTTSGGTEYIPLGGFTQRDKPDANGAGPGAGPNTANAYSAPGEDFVSGTPRTLNDGTYGVVISAEPTTVALGRPLLPLLRRDLIEAGTPARQVLLLTRPAAAPRLEVIVDR